MEAERKADAQSKRAAAMGVVLGLRRRKLDLTQRAVADRAGMRAAVLGEIEAGSRQPTSRELSSLAQSLETTPSRLLAEAELWTAVERSPGPSFLHAAAIALRQASELRDALLEHALALTLPAARPCQEEREAERLLAEQSWQRLRPLSPAARRASIGGDPVLADPRFMRWGLVERLCLECEGMLHTDPPAATTLAELALHVAERVGGTPTWKRHLQGYAWAYIAKAKLGAADRAGAEAAAEKARGLWSPSRQKEPDLLSWPL